ncbi:MAG: response regulator [Lachnospiraceae bacterium]|nr:response regulator [Lachnospiraceae bacterium]
MYRILIADDEIIERTVLERKLRQNFQDRCIITQATNGREVIAMARQEMPDLMILDIEMPGVSGLEAAETVRSWKKPCSIIFLTAFQEFDYARKAVSVHALEYLLKPCDDQELILSVEEAIRIARERRRDGISEADPDAPMPVGRTEDENDGLHNTRADAVRNYIELHYAEDLSVRVMAEHFGYSEVYFCKLFKQHFGESFVSYLTRYRIREAQRLLADESVNIKDVGRTVGYEDSNYFTKVFRRIVNMSPTEYRASCQ